MFYAQLDGSNVCTAVTQSAGPLSGSRFIQLSFFDLAVLGMKWHGGVWVEVPV